MISISDDSEASNDSYKEYPFETSSDDEEQAEVRNISNNDVDNFSAFLSDEVVSADDAYVVQSMKNEEDYMYWIEKEKLFFDYRYNKLYCVPSISQTFKVVGFVCSARFGPIYLALSEQRGLIHAMKIVSKEEVIKSGEARYVINERKILDTVQHPMIVNLIERKMTNSNLYIITRLSEYGVLAKVMALQPRKRFSLEMGRFYFTQIVLAIEYLHCMRIIYRDLQLKHVALRFDGYIQLVELGYSKLLPRGFDKTYTVLGSIEHSAPEVFSSENCGYSFSADWWSAGCLLFEMLSGHPPFYVKSASPMDTLNDISHGVIDFPTDFDADAENLVRALCSKVPTARVKYEPSGLTTLRDVPFFKSTDFIKIFNKEVKPPYDPSMEGTRAYSVTKLTSQMIEEPNEEETIFQYQFYNF